MCIRDRARLAPWLIRPCTEATHKDACSLRHMRPYLRIHVAKLVVDADADRSYIMFECAGLCTSQYQYGLIQQMLKMREELGRYLACVDTSMFVSSAHHTISQCELCSKPVASSANLHRYERNARLLQRSPAPSYQFTHVYTCYQTKLQIRSVRRYRTMTLIVT